MFTGGKSFVSSPPAFSNDAKRLLVCTGNTVSIFSTSTGLQTSELEGHEAQVTSVIVVPASTPASKVLCYCWTSSLDGKIKYWDFAAPELMNTIDIRFPIHSMVIPSLLSQPTESNGKLPVQFAYVYTEDVKQNEEKLNSSRGQIRKCNLMKSRLVGGVTLAESKKPGSITACPFGRYIGIYEKRKFRIWEIPAKDSDNVVHKKIRLHHTKSITALAFHPTERVVAAGDVTGRILIWRGVGRGTFGNDNNKFTNRGLDKNTEDRPGVRDGDDADSCTTWHWHSAQVNVLFFSSDGAYLYSGGKEGVLVVWQLDTGKKKFLPRIGSPLLYFINSPDPSLCSISCSDNRIQLLRMPTMEILRSISGIKLPSSHMEMYEGFGSNVVFNSTSGLIAVPTENYRVQFYSLFNDREISEVQICERNHQPGDEVTVIVNLVALSPDGSTMSTVETRLPEEGIGSLVSLKFWACSSQSTEFSLSTVIYEPHREAGVSSIAFRPTSHMAVTTSYGGDFKVWVCKQEIHPNDQATGWTCHALGSYKKKPMNAAAFSSDGSVLAVAAEKFITLWDPDRNTLLAVIGDSLEPITNLSFVGKSNYLVSASRGSNPRLTLWNMLKLCTTWSYRLDIEAIACSTDNSTFAVLGLWSPSEQMVSFETILQGTDGVILLFNAENPVPLSTWLVSKAQGGRLSFVQSTRQSEDTKINAANEVLTYVNGAHEYVLLNLNGKQSELSISRQQNFSSLEKTERSGYASIYGELPEFSLKTDQTQFAPAPSDKTWKTIFSGPSHSLPPLPKLCSDFLESLLERRPAIAQRAVQNFG
ncbi:WD repeat-containing protein 75 [Phtheirospermum japonicum]|uniref:WD repeat-containing protein 75 n=1 Tax=Phtheirospermum japonicum TaxID=374723 RepID=A0A830CRM9_9LAMI|nr:WD repeat-containing protein 75 [Phtheirospermum japonicum]